MTNYIVWVRPRLDVDADSEDEAKQILADALSGWGLTIADIGCETADEDV